MQNLKENCKPTGASYRKNQRNMGKRPVKVVPVGAWVELESANSCTGYAAILSAEQEERRMLQAQTEKQAKLERFRRDVKQRVRQLQQAKRQEQLQQSFHAVELQSSVVQQSSHAVECSTPKKDRCLYRHDNEALTIGQASDHITSGSESDHDVLDCQKLTEQSHRVHRIVTQAKRSLAARQMFLQQSDLPGGSWGAEYSRDKQHEEQIHTRAQSQEQVTDVASQSTENDTKIPQQPVDELSSYGDMENQPQSLSHDPDALHQLAGVPVQKTVTFASELGKSKGHGVKNQTAKVEEKSTSHQSQTETFGHLSDQYTSDMARRPDRKDVSSKTNRKKKSGLQMNYTRTVPELNPGVQAEENKQRIGNQYSMYRRLFMDIEREQVRENIRKKEHQRNIQRLKEEKEKERRKAEADALHAVQPRNLTGETQEEAYQRQREEQQQMEQVLQRERHRKQKNTEINRYIRALKAMMREKIKQMGIEVPPLCACGPSVWDANPDTCANNCLFYKNPKAYAKALHSLLMSCDLS